MKFILTYEQYLTFINEAVTTVDEIYGKYYTDIDTEIFYQIVKSDPTYIEKDNKIGVYTKWLLNLYKKNSILLEDLYKATEYLTLYHELKKRNKISKKDINMFKSLSELYLEIKQFDESNKDTVFRNEDEKLLSGQFKEVYKDEKWRIIIPITLEASKYFAKGTKWCTQYPDNFNSYTKKGDLYILIPEDGNLNNRLQFHFKEKQYMDIDDKSINLDNFFKSNPKLHEFFFDLQKEKIMEFDGSSLVKLKEMIKNLFFKININNLFINPIIEPFILNKLKFKEGNFILEEKSKSDLFEYDLHDVDGLEEFAGKHKLNDVKEYYKKLLKIDFDFDLDIDENQYNWGFFRISDDATIFGLINTMHILNKHNIKYTKHPIFKKIEIILNSFLSDHILNKTIYNTDKKMIEIIGTFFQKCERYSIILNHINLSKLKEAIQYYYNKFAHKFSYSKDDKVSDIKLRAYTDSIKYALNLMIKLNKY